MTTSIDEALRDADVVMALRIQRERMAGGPAAVAARVRRAVRNHPRAPALAKPGRPRDASGPDERGRRDRARRGRRATVGHHRPGHERRRRPHGVAVPARRARRDGRAAGEVGRSSTDLEISRAWLVDPAAGREGPGEIVVRDGQLEAVTWLEGADADGIDDRGVVVAPGFIDLHVAPARAGQRGCRDDRVGARRRGPRRLHDRLRDAEHDARRSTSPACSPGSRGRASRAGRQWSCWPTAR